MKRVTSFLLAMVLFAGLVLTGAPSAYAASNMGVSDALVEVLKKEEGFSAKPYWDYGQYTVGYGTRCPDDMLEEYMENGISKEDAELLLRNYLSGTERTINKKFIDKYGLTLTQGQFDALVSFTYNCGSAWISDTSGTFHNAVKKGLTGSELIRAFSLWCNAGGSILPGLVRRRLCEANMYLNGEYSTKKPSNYCYVYYNANGGSVSYRIQGYDSNEGVAPAYKATYSGHTFLGWYTAKTGGSKVTKLTKSMSGDTLYARWDTEGEDVVTNPVEGVTVTVTGSGVNLRKGPGTNYSIVGTAQEGDEMVITETASGSGYEWGNDDGKWIALKYTNYDEVVNETPEETTEPTEPETTVPETTEPEPTDPETTVPETTVPETTVPETTEPEPTEPETTVPETTVPETTVPETTEPEPTEPETTVPETTKPEPTEPEPTEPEPTEPEPTEPEKVKLTGKVKASGGLAVRKGPGTGYAVKKYLNNGTKVTVTELQENGSTTWGKISSGWISMKYVVLDNAEPEPTEPKPTEPAPTEPKPTEPKPTEPKPAEPKPTEPEPKPEKTNLTGKVKASGGLAVRKGAGTSYAIKKYLKNGAKVTITALKTVKGTEWGKISSGWVCMDYIVLDSEKEEQKEDNIKTVIADSLNVRKSPSTSAKIVGYYRQGAKIKILETKKIGSTTWGRTSKGWISMKYVK